MKASKLISIVLILSLIATPLASFTNIDTVNHDFNANGMQESDKTLDFSGFSNATTITQPNSCVKQVNEEMESQRQSINLTKAISPVANSNEFQSDINGYNSTYYQTFGIWSWDVNCNITLQGIKIFYSISNATGSEGYVVVTENPQLNSVINVTTQNPVFHTTGSNGIWSGYEMQASASSTHPNTPVYEADAVWQVPTVSVPPYSSCLFTHCDISIWPGLVANKTGIFVNGSKGGAIVQAGSDSGISCFPFCIPSYYLWTEFEYSNGNKNDPGATNCLNINAGDQVYSDIIDEAEFRGNVNLYDIYIGDITSNASCTPITAYPFQMGTPMYAEFEGETLLFRNINSTAILPQFTSFTMSGFLYDPINGLYSMSNSYQPNLYNSFILTNAGGVGGNINFGRADSGSFTSTWSPNCVVPSGSWTVSSSCTITQFSAVNGNIIVQPEVNLYLPYNVRLEIDLTQHHITVKNGGTFWVKYGGAVN